jgi:hypothetical protein
LENVECGFRSKDARAFSGKVGTGFTHTVRATEDLERGSDAT